VWNIITFVLYGADKFLAKRQKKRISETTLISCAFLMGAIGATLGMVMFRHKTRRVKFKLLISTALVVNMSLAIIFHYVVV
jgi:uncharacterized membrane protein YsdA (DUF1294 family)